MGQEASLIFGSAAGTAMVLSVALVAVFRRLRPWTHLFDDLIGEDARPGRPRSPGLVERMAENEDRKSVV